jgi:hypothetical protein
LHVNDPPYDKLPMALQQARTWAFSQMRFYLSNDSQFTGDEVASIRADRQKNEYPLGDRPLVVLTRGRPAVANPPGVTDGPTQAQREQERKAHQADLASLSRIGKQVIAEGSRHEIQLDAPDLVVQAIRDVIAATTK